MQCCRCGAELSPGIRECPDCGSQVYGNDFVYATLTLTRQEAKKGGLKLLEMRNLVEPLRVRVKPRSRTGDKLRVPGAMFHMADESVLLAPVEVTIHVEPVPLWQPVMAVLLCLLFLAGSVTGIYAAVNAGEDDPSQQVSAMLPSQNIPTVSATTPASPLTTNPTTETTEPSEPETTEPSEPETTEPHQRVSKVIQNYEMRPLLHQLSDEHLADLEAIYQAALNFETTCELPYPVNVEEFGYIMMLMSSECPELLHVNTSVGYTYHYDPTTNMVTDYTLPLTLTEEEYADQYAACRQVIDDLVAQTSGMTDWEKERFVFDYITQNCVYDMQGDYAYSAYGTLGAGVAKCDGISLATKWLLEEMGINCMVVSGDPTVGEIGHAWNYVELDGQYYGLDVTADVRKADNPGPVTYCAFNVTTEQVEQTYILRDTYVKYVDTPNVTTMEKSYHVQEGNYLSAGADWSSRIAAEFLEACKNNGSFLLQFESKADFDACRAGMDQVLKDAYRNSGNTKAVSWNSWYMEDFYVLHVQVTS